MHQLSDYRSIYPRTRIWVLWDDETQQQHPRAQHLGRLPSDEGLAATA